MSRELLASGLHALVRLGVLRLLWGCQKVSTAIAIILRSPHAALLTEPALQPP